MRKAFTITLCALAGLLLLLLLTLGGKREDVFLAERYAFSEDGTKLTFSVGVASSMGYVRSCRTKQDGDGMYVTFYSTFGLNSRFLANHQFEIELPPACSKIYFYRGPNEYKLVLVKDPQTGQWERNR